MSTFLVIFNYMMVVQKNIATVPSFHVCRREPRSQHWGWGGPQWANIGFSGLLICWRQCLGVFKDPIYALKEVFLFKWNRVKDVLMGIPKSDLLGITMVVIHVAGQIQTVQTPTKVNGHSLNIMRTVRNCGHFYPVLRYLGAVHNYQHFLLWTKQL